MTDPKQLNVEVKAELKGALNQWIFEQADGCVQSGPFQGMKMRFEESWHDGNLGAKILGCYETELHAGIEEEITRLTALVAPKIVNIGCAEGFYAIGMAGRLPAAKVYAFDPDPRAIEILNLAATDNKLANQIVTGVPMLLHLNDADLIICDCEGAEAYYLDKVIAPGLAKTTIIVECHDYERQEITTYLMQHFEDTHDIFGVEEGARDPNMFPMLRGIHGHARWLAVSEGRPCTMHWLHMKPKGQTK